MMFDMEFVQISRTLTPVLQHCATIRRQKSDYYPGKIGLSRHKTLYNYFVDCLLTDFTWDLRALSSSNFYR